MLTSSEQLDDAVSSLFVSWVGRALPSLRVTISLDEALVEPGGAVGAHKQTQDENKTIVEATDVAKSIPISVPCPFLYDHLI